MTAITFPNDPNTDPGVGGRHTAQNGLIYVWDGEKWESLGTNNADPNNFVQVSGDNMTGPLTIGPEGGTALTTLGDDGSATFTGNVTTPGVVFGTASGNVTSKTLDDYEEGTWTPTFFDNAGGSSTNVIWATYVKIGRFVEATCFIRLNTTGTLDAVTPLIIYGLPYASISNTNAYSGVSVGFFLNFATDFSSVTGTVSSDTDQILLRGKIADDTGGVINLDASRVRPQSQIILTACYSSN